LVVLLLLMVDVGSLLQHCPSPPHLLLSLSLALFTFTWLGLLARF